MAYIKRRLLFDYFSGDLSRFGDNGAFKEKVRKLRDEKVKTVFILTSREIELEPYLKLIRLYENYGFFVNSVNINALDDDHLVFLKNAVEDINAGFRKGNCAIISFGESVAGALLAGFYIYSGRKLNDALEKVRLFNRNFVTAKEEINFLRRFQRYLNIQEDELPEEKKEALKGKAESDKVSSLTQDIKKKEKTEKIVEKQAIREDKKTGTGVEPAKEL